MKIIMLCGQGSAGKSTTAQRLLDTYPGQNYKVVSMDEIVISSPVPLSSSEIAAALIQQTQEAIDSAVELLILDQAFDSVGWRKKFLNQLIFPPNVELLVLALRPALDQIIEWQTKRQFPRPLSEEAKTLIRRAYSGFQPPTEEEFKEYHFSDVQIYTIDPSSI